MKTLAIEFSSAERTVALLDLDPSSGPICRAQTSETGFTTANAFEMIERVLREADWQREDITQIAIGLGPGSYTGIRAAIAMAQGWSLAHDIKLLGVNSSQALAARAGALESDAPLAIAIDAQRGEYHAARITREPTIETIPEPDLKLVAAETLTQWLNEGIRVVGPNIGKKVPGASDLSPDARHVGLLALRGALRATGENLEPIYLREVNFVKAPAPRRIPENKT